MDWRHGGSELEFAVELVIPREHVVDVRRWCEENTSRGDWAAVWWLVSEEAVFRFGNKTDAAAFKLLWHRW
jgi:hypothetical protein